MRRAFTLQMHDRIEPVPAWDIKTFFDGNATRADRFPRSSTAEMNKAFADHMMKNTILYQGKK